MAKKKSFGQKNRPTTKPVVKDPISILTDDNEENKSTDNKEEETNKNETSKQSPKPASSPEKQRKSEPETETDSEPLKINSNTKPRKKEPESESNSSNQDRRRSSDPKKPITTVIKSSLIVEIDEVLTKYRMTINLNYSKAQLIEDGVKKQIAALNRELKKKDGED